MTSAPKWFWSGKWLVSDHDPDQNDGGPREASFGPGSGS